MMHQNNLIVAIRNNHGEILRESGINVYMAFNSTYSLLLKNTNNRKALAEVWIDGTRVLGENGLIVDANSLVDLKRFCVDGNLKEGREFTFVPASDSRVQDPTSADNGKINVKFTLEQQTTYPWWLNPPYWDYNYSHRCYPSYYWQYGGCCPSTGISGFSGVSGQIGTVGSSTINSSGNTSYCSPNIIRTASISQNVGATVEGNVSDQRFNVGSIGVLETTSTYINLMIVPREETLTVAQTQCKFCVNCGKKMKFQDKFCAQCGTKS